MRPASHMPEAERMTLALPVGVEGLGLIHRLGEGQVVELEEVAPPDGGDGVGVQVAVEVA